MNLTQFQHKISKYLNLKLDLRINDNRSTMLHVLEKRGGMARVSMHRKFLEAPEEVIAAIAHYVRGTSRATHDVHRVLRTFIHSHCVTSSSHPRMDEAVLETCGATYDLKKLFDALNAHYFRNQLRLQVTWYGHLRRRTARPRRLTFGLYYDSLKLIKIHRILDDPFFPSYFVSYVVYHEMLHSVVPGVVDEKGHLRVHTPSFKEREREFVDYDKAMHWERVHKEQIFRHGRT